MVAVRLAPRYIPRRGTVLARLAEKHGWTIGAELGVLRGDTFLLLLNKCPRLTMVGVDLWRPMPEMEARRGAGGRTYLDHDLESYYASLKRRVAPFGDRAVLLRRPTAEGAALFPDGYFDFVFIDADHTAEGVAADMFAWVPKVKASGWICGHDYNPRDFPGVVRVVDEALPNRRLYPDAVWAVPKAETVFG